MPIYYKNFFQCVPRCNTASGHLVYLYPQQHTNLKINLPCYNNLNEIGNSSAVTSNYIFS